MKIFVCLTMVIIILSCCTNANSAGIDEARPKQITSDVPIPADICYVLCDFSASQGNSLQTVKEKAYRIYDAAKLKCEVFFFDINGPQFSDPFFSSDLLLKNAKRPSDKENFKKKADSLGNTLKVELSKKSVPNASQNTCIIRSITTTVQSLTDKIKNSEQRIWIIILSDMLEDCTYDFGKIDIDNASYEIAMKQLDKMPKAIFTLKDFKNINIKLAVCSKDNTISSEKLFLFWKKVFARYDYNLVRPPTQELPNWVTKF